MKALTIIAALALAACAPLAPQQVASGPGVGKPCGGSVQSNGCFPGGRYPHSYLAEGGNPDKGSDGGEGSDSK